MNEKNIQFNIHSKSSSINNNNNLDLVIVCNIEITDYLEVLICLLISISV